MFYPAFASIILYFLAASITYSHVSNHIFFYNYITLLFLGSFGDFASPLLDI